MDSKKKTVCDDCVHCRSGTGVRRKMLLCWCTNFTRATEIPNAKKFAHCSTFHAKMLTYRRAIYNPVPNGPSPHNAASDNEFFFSFIFFFFYFTYLATGIAFNWCVMRSFARNRLSEQRYVVSRTLSHVVARCMCCAI